LRRDSRSGRGPKAILRCRAEGHIAFDDDPVEIASLFVAMAQGEWSVRLGIGMLDELTDKMIEDHPRRVTRLLLKGLARRGLGIDGLMRGPACGRRTAAGQVRANGPRDEAGAKQATKLCVVAASFVGVFASAVKILDSPKMKRAYRARGGLDICRVTPEFKISPPASRTRGCRLRSNPSMLATPRRRRQFSAPTCQD